MKKLFFLFILLLLFILPIKAQKADFSFKSIQLDDNEPKINGKVRTILTLTYKSDKVSETTVETFDAKKRRREFISHRADIEVHSGELVASNSKEIYFYNSKSGKLDLILRYDEKGKLWGKTKFIYDTNGLLQEEILYSEKNRLDLKKSYTYNEQKMEVTVAYSKFNEGKIVSDNNRRLMQFNEKGQLVKSQDFSVSGNVWNSVSFEYDEKGLLVKENSCSGDNCQRTFEYVFDVHGNWIERVKLFTKKDENGEPNFYEAERVFRTITYYTDNLN